MIIFYDKENQFELTDEEFSKALPAFNSGKSIWVERLKVHLSPFYKWAGTPPVKKDEGYLHDGTFVVKKFGQWIMPDQPEIKLDYNYYPELAKDEVYPENPKNKLSKYERPDNKNFAHKAI